ncbi:MAG: hypothetical protein LBF68_07560 [Christensenellaceae bacterium]|jgi:hypothetical protein|nr:hypothetical protein [Christensenellaceae bacterium]
MKDNINLNQTEEETKAFAKAYSKVYRERLEGFGKLYPKEDTAACQDILAKYSEYVLDRNSYNATREQHHYDFTDRHWHGLLNPGYKALGFLVLNCRDNFNFVLLDRLGYRFPCGVLGFNDDQLRDFYFDQTGEPLYDHTNHVGEKQMENYSGVIFTPYTDLMVIQKLAKIRAAEAQTNCYMFHKRRTGPSSNELAKYESDCNKWTAEFSTYPNLRSWSCEWDVPAKFNFTEQDGINVYGEPARLAVCLDNKSIQDHDVDLLDFICRSQLVARMICQKEMRVFKNGFPKDLAINKYIILKPKKTLREKVEERIAEEKKREAYELKQKIIQEKVKAEFERHAIKR